MNSLKKFHLEIDWSYPVYLLALFFLTGIFICCDIFFSPTFQSIINFSNLMRFLDFGSFLAIAACTMLVVFACALIKPFGQALVQMFFKKKSDTIDYALCRRAVHTAMAGCVLGDILYMIITSCNLFAELDFQSDIWILIVGSFGASFFCSAFYTTLFLLILLPISVKLKRYLQ